MNDTNATIPVSKVRSFLRRIATEGKFLRNQGGAWSFDSRAPFTGITNGTTYQTEDQAIDALLGVYFPELQSKAA